MSPGRTEGSESRQGNEARLVPGDPTGTRARQVYVGSNTGVPGLGKAVPGVSGSGRRVTGRCQGGPRQGLGLAGLHRDPEWSQAGLCQAGSRKGCGAKPCRARWGCARRGRARSPGLRGTGLCQPDSAIRGARPSAAAGRGAGQAAATVPLPEAARGRAHAAAVAARLETSLAPRSPPARPALSVPPGSGFPVGGRCFRSPVPPPPPSPEQPPRRAPAARRCLPSPAPAQPSPAGRGARPPRPGGGRQRAPTRRGPGRTLGAAASPAARVPTGGAEGARRSPQPWQDAAFLPDPAGALLHPPLPRQHHRALVVSRTSRGGCQEGAQGPSVSGDGPPAPAWGQRCPLHPGQPLSGDRCSLAGRIQTGGTPTLPRFGHASGLGTAGCGTPRGMGQPGPAEGTAGCLPAPQAHSLGGLYA